MQSLLLPHNTDVHKAAASNNAIQNVQTPWSAGSKKSTREEHKVWSGLRMYMHLVTKILCIWPWSCAEHYVVLLGCV